MTASHDKLASQGLLSRLANLPAAVYLSSVAFFIIHVFLRSEDYTLLQGTIAGVGGVIALNVIISYFRRKEFGIPVLEWAFLHYYLFFVFPVFVEAESTPSVSISQMQRSGAVDFAFIANILLFVSVLAAWKLGKKTIKLKPTTANPPALSVFVVFLYGLTSILLSFLLWRMKTLIQLEWYAYMLQVVFSPYIAQALLLFEAVKRPDSRRLKIAVTIVTLGIVLYGLLSSRLDFVLQPLVIVGFSIMAAKGRISTRILVGGFFLVLIINPAKHMYRSIVGFRTHDFAEQSIGEMWSAWSRSFESIWSGDSNKEEMLNTTSSRINYIDTNATAIYMVPEIVSYEYGWPWRAILYSAIPRFIWKDKPSLTVITNDYFAITMGISSEKICKSSTAAYPAIADGYWNFGWPGIVIVGLLEGFLFVLIFRLFGRRSRWRYTFALIITAEMRSAGPMTSIIGGILQPLVVIFIIVKIFESFSKSNRSGK